jgi:alpha-galactosidase
VPLSAGLNSIQFGSPTSYPPDMDRIVISGDGFEVPPLPKSITYEAENATLAGTVTPPYCEYCSGAGEAGNIGGGAGNTVTFPNVIVEKTGTYQMEVDYLTSGPRSVFMKVDGGANIELDFNGSSFSLPTSTVIPVQLHAGPNTIQFGNDTGYAPALDRIVIAPIVESANLTASITGKEGAHALRIWKVSLSNLGVGRANGSQINAFSITQVGGDGACHPRIIGKFPIEVGDILAGGHANMDVPIDFSRCSGSARFSLDVVFSANNGSDVGETTTTAEPR